MQHKLQACLMLLELRISNTPRADVGVVDSAMGALGATAPYTDLTPARTRTRTRKKSDRAPGPAFRGRTGPLIRLQVGCTSLMSAQPDLRTGRAEPGPIGPLGRLRVGRRNLMPARGAAAALRGAGPRVLGPPGPRVGARESASVRHRGRFAVGGAPGPDVWAGCKTAREATAPRELGARDDRNCSHGHTPPGKARGAGAQPVGPPPVRRRWTLDGGGDDGRGPPDSDDFAGALHRTRNHGDWQHWPLAREIRVAGGSPENHQLGNASPPLLAWLLVATSAGLAACR